MDGSQQPRHEYTLAQINTYLQQEYPNEFSALPVISSFVFTSAPRALADGDLSRGDLNLICNVQLLLGHSDGEYTTDEPVYLCLGRDAHNRVSLNCNGNIYKFNLDNLSYIHLNESFRKLLRSEKEVEVLHDAERKRLKAYACYLFLQAGHVDTIQVYSGFVDDLRYASAWLAREDDGPVKTARQKAAISRQKEDAARKRNEAVKHAGGTPAPSGVHNARHETPAYPGIDRATASLPRQDTHISRHLRVVESVVGEDMQTQASKKRKFGETIAEIRERYEIAGRHLLAFETELVSMKLDPDAIAELRHVNSQLVGEIEKLKQQLKEQNSDIEKWRSACHKIKESMRECQTELLQAKMDASVSKQNANKEKADREEESKRREEAESRLSGYLEELKRMAQLYSGALH